MSRNSALQFYSKYGFKVFKTGGGNTALRADLGLGLYILITSAEYDLTAPEEAAEPVEVGLYSGDNAEAIAFFSAPDCDAVMTRLGRGDWMANELPRRK